MFARSSISKLRLKCGSLNAAEFLATNRCPAFYAPTIALPRQNSPPLISLAALRVRPNRSVST
jgi:hypothetical protein